MAENTALPSWIDTIGVFDLETTGIDVYQDRIVTAHVGVLNRDGESVSARSWLADPGIPIPPQASSVHGITTERARAEGRPATEVVGEIRDALAELFSADIPVVAYNASYDFSLLASECARHGIQALDATPVVDPLIIDKVVDKYRKGKRTLNLVAEHYGVSLDDAHTADADAEAAGRVALALLAQYGNKLPESAQLLHEAQITWAQQQAADLTEYLVRVGRLQAGEVVEGEWPVRTS